MKTFLIGLLLMATTVGTASAGEIVDPHCDYATMTCDPEVLVGLCNGDVTLDGCYDAAVTVACDALTEGAGTAYCLLRDQKHCAMYPEECFGL